MAIWHSAPRLAPGKFVELGLADRKSVQVFKQYGIPPPFAATPGHHPENQQDIVVLLPPPSWIHQARPGGQRRQPLVSIRTECRVWRVAMYLLLA